MNPAGARHYLLLEGTEVDLALDAAAVLAVREAGPRERAVDLSAQGWAPAVDPLLTPRVVVVRTPAGLCTLACPGKVRVAELAVDAPLELPPTLGANPLVSHLLPAEGAARPALLLKLTALDDPEDHHD